MGVAHPKQPLFSSFSFYFFVHASFYNHFSYIITTILTIYKPIKNRFAFDIKCIQFAKRWIHWSVCSQRHFINCKMEFKTVSFGCWLGSKEARGILWQKPFCQMSKDVLSLWEGVLSGVLDRMLHYLIIHYVDTHICRTNCLHKEKEKYGPLAW